MPVTSAVGSRRATAHWARATGVAALDTALHFLRATEAVSPEFIAAHISPAAEAPEPAQFWQVTGGITSKTDDFHFAENYLGMEVIAEAGTLIAHDGDEPILTPYDDCLLMMPNFKSGRNMRKLRLCRRMR